MKHFMVVATVLAVLGLNAPALHSAGAPAQGETAQQTRRVLMISAARQVNTAEMAQQQATGKFADWKTLAESRVLKMPLQIPSQVDVRVFADSDKRFSVTLKDTQDPCLYTVFSDERGIIFQGQVVQGCTE